MKTKMIHIDVHASEHLTFDHLQRRIFNALPHGEIASVCIRPAEEPQATGDFGLKLTRKDDTKAATKIRSVGSQRFVGLTDLEWAKIRQAYVELGGEPVRKMEYITPSPTSIFGLRPTCEAKLKLDYFDFSEFEIRSAALAVRVEEILALSIHGRRLEDCEISLS